MVTGDYYYMSELAFGASMNQLSPNETYRGFSRFFIGSSYSSVRAQAWTLRDMAEAAYLLPDAYPLKAEFNAAVNDSLASWNQNYTNNPSANPLHVTEGSAVYSVNGGTKNGVAPWQHNFLTWSLGHATELGFAGAADFRRWLAGFEIGLMTDWLSDPTHGYCWLEASAYSPQTKDAAGNWLPSFTAVYAANWPTLVGLACNSPAMLTELARLRGEPTQAGEMAGYPSSSTGFPANFQIGIASAADSGLPSAQDAWSLFDSRSVKPSGSTAYNNYPNFAVIPRLVEAGAPPPPTMPPTLYPPPTSTPPLVTISPPPVPKELPARKCTASRCGATSPSAANAEPVRTVTATRPVVAGNPGTGMTSDTHVSSKVSTTGAVRAPTTAVRFLVRVVCNRFDTWCRHFIPQTVYVPVPAAPRAEAAPAKTEPPVRAASVAPALTPRVSAAYAPANSAAEHVLRR